jgi:hypothetical protein
MSIGGIVLSGVVSIHSALAGAATAVGHPSGSGIGGNLAAGRQHTSFLIESLQVVAT